MYFSGFTTLTTWATVAGVVSYALQPSQFPKNAEERLARMRPHLMQPSTYWVQWQLAQRLWESNYKSTDGEIHDLETNTKLSGTESHGKDWALLLPVVFTGL